MKDHPISSFTLGECAVPLVLLLCGLFLGGFLAGSFRPETVQEPSESAIKPSIEIVSEADVEVLVDGACDVKITTPAEVTLTMGWETTVSAGSVSLPNTDCSPGE